MLEVKFQVIGFLIRKIGEEGGGEDLRLIKSNPLDFKALFFDSKIFTKWWRVNKNDLWTTTCSNLETNTPEIIKVYNCLNADNI